MTMVGQWIAALAVPASMLFVQPVFAHTDALARASGAEPWLAVILIIALALYMRGLYRLQAASTSFALACCFAVGWAAVAIALVSPWALESEGIFSAHMVQHELLIAVGAPLMVLGRPLAIWTWGLPVRWRSAVARPFRRRAVSAAWNGLTTPHVATLLHAAAIWGWHIPYLFERAEASAIWHALQHSAFLLSALLFWWVLLKPGSAQRTGPALLCLFITMLHTSALGVLLTFSDEVWYSESTSRAGYWGLTALEDQQLGGLIMWVPGGVPYIVAAVALATRWFNADPVVRPHPANTRLT